MGNEITVKMKCTVAEIKEILKERKFMLNRSFTLNDTYFIPMNLKLENLSVRDILKKAVLLREIKEIIPNEKKSCKLTFKKKEIDENGNILKQEKIDCEILKKEEGKNLIQALGYKEIMNIKEEDEEYTNGEIELAIKDIENGANLIEIEENEKFDTIEKLKKELDKLKIPVDTSNYFVKKAEVELEKILKQY
ncbi:MAG: hypothetical protein HFJ50_05800 [Clostridia bacterium]|nr:hypothetical protein [Clostridia bacterium]